MPTTVNNDIIYWIENSLHEILLEKLEIRSCLQDYLSKTLSLKIEVLVDAERKSYYQQCPQRKYKILLVEKCLDPTAIKIKLSDNIEAFFSLVQKKAYKNESLEWFKWFIRSKKALKFLDKLVNKKLDNMITTFTMLSDILVVYYISKQLTGKIEIEQLDYLLNNEILKETIALPLPYQQSPKLSSELKQYLSEHKDDDEILIISNSVASKTQQKNIILFGYATKVNDSKRQILSIIDRNTLITYKLDPINELNSFLSACSNELNKIEHEYKQDGIHLRLRFNEFIAPSYLKEKVESSIQKILFQSGTTVTFETIQLYKNIAINEEQHLKSIAERCRCYITIKFKHEYKEYSVLKMKSTTQINVSKSIETQSGLFSSLTNVFRKMIVANGSIELRTGDIALQQVDAIVISTMFNGLKEGVIERAGQFTYENNHLQNDGTMYTITNGGELNCKTILFSNWVPNVLMNNEDVLRLSIRSFISKSIEYIINEKNCESIAFAVPDSCLNEMILAEEMILEAKQQLETSKSKLKISFVLLPEQDTLYEHFENIIHQTDTVFAYFDWPMITMQVTLMASDDYNTNRCKDRINKYLSRATTSIKIIDSNGIFHDWDQHTLNSFYKYCIDRSVLAKLDETQTILELIGHAGCASEVKLKFTILTRLIREKFNDCLSLTGDKTSNVYNIAISHCLKDVRKCRRLVKRLTEEGFSVWFDFSTKEDQRDLRLQLNKSDCIILCISENYYENDACREEAKYAFQTNKNVFLVKLQNKPLFGWNYILFDCQLFFHPFGSDNYFDFEYGRLLIELLKCTKPGFTTLVKRRSSRMLDTHQYQDLSEKSYLTQDTNTIKRQLSFNEENWLRTLDNIPKTNSLIHIREIVRLTDVKFVNHAIVDDHIELYVPSLTKTAFSLRPSYTYLQQQPILSYSTHKMPFDESEAYGQPTRKIEPKTFELSQVFDVNNSSVEFIPRRRCVRTFNPYVMLHMTETYNRTDDEMKQRQKLDDPNEMIHKREKLAEYFLKTYKHYTRQQLDKYLKFAQRMKDNQDQFEIFCS